ncbi:MAG: hypothetical protein JNL98_13410 [Bryobacterales bacterium]|nr:hypothetical protein [Bryobacterales bacterium]
MTSGNPCATIREWRERHCPDLTPNAPFAELVRISALFRTWLAERKQEIGGGGFDWYRYDTLAGFPYLRPLFLPPFDKFLQLAGTEPVLDLGCQDGDLTFFLEALGHRVHAIDNPVTSFNEMRGLRAMHRHIQSGATLESLDIDGYLSITRPHGLCIFLGVLYHLKNPFFVLETIARYCRYCLLSTRVASLFPPATASMESVSAAYLLRERELNQDATNYWVFTDKGLRTLLDRTNWEVCSEAALGDRDRPDPVSANRDARAFVLLRSRVAGGPRPVECVLGWHDPEPGGFRWTEDRFTLRTRAGGAARALSIECFIPAQTMDTFGSLSLSAAVDGVTVLEQTFRAEGRYVLMCPLNRGHERATPVTIEFALNHVLGPTMRDARRLGIVVGAIEEIAG